MSLGRAPATAISREQQFWLGKFFAEGGLMLKLGQGAAASRGLSGSGQQMSGVADENTRHMYRVRDASLSAPSGCVQYT